MYNLNVHAHQSLQHSIIFVSVSETDETGHTEMVFESSAHAEGVTAGHDGSDLESFLDQTIRGIVKALSMGESVSVRALESMSQSTVGGGAPGQMGSARTK